MIVTGFQPWLAAPRGGTNFWIQPVTIDPSSSSFVLVGTATVLSGTITSWEADDDPQMRAIQPLNAGQTNNMRLRKNESARITGLFQDFSTNTGASNGFGGVDGSSSLKRLYNAYSTFLITRDVGGDRVEGVYEGAGYHEVIDGEGTATFEMRVAQRGSMSGPNPNYLIAGATGTAPTS